MFFGYFSLFIIHLDPKKTKAKTKKPNNLQALMVPLQTTPYLRPLQLKHSLVYKHFDINLKVASCSSHGDKMEFFI